MGERDIVENRKAHHDFFLFDKWEAGIALKGFEVKSIRDGHSNLKDAYVRVHGGDVHVVNFHIAGYRHQSQASLEPVRSRRLLLRKREIEKLSVQVTRKGFVCIPTRLYWKRNLVKMEIALAKRKKAYDKRQVLKAEIQKREMDQAIKRNSRQK